MNREIKVVIENLGVEFTTTSTFKSFAFIIAVFDYEFNEGLAIEVADLCYEVYANANDHINFVDIIDYICENYDNLPDDFKDLSEIVYEGVYSFDL
jgi:hypothetical protein